MPRILCVDFGERRTGVAVSDPTETIAQGLATIEHGSAREQLVAVRRLATEFDVREIVVGLPLSLSGRPSTRSEQVRAFASRLGQLTGLPVKLHDERLTTAMANRLLQEVHRRAGRSREMRHSRQSPKGDRDRVAATIILEDYLAASR